MPYKRFFVKQTSATQTFTFTVERLKSIKVENLSCTGYNNREILYLQMIGNPNAVLPELPIDLAVNTFQKDPSTTIDYTYIVRGNLDSVNIIASNRNYPDVNISNTQTDITEIEITCGVDSGNITINANNPLCYELTMESFY